LTPNTHWRIIGVNKINDISFFGITKEMTKLSIVLKSVSTKIYLHEWGHCYEPEVDGDWDNLNPNGMPPGIYKWPLTYGIHYGQYSDGARFYQPWYGLNIMHFGDGNGYDGDNNWRHEKYPWYIHHYYNSYRWDENY